MKHPSSRELFQYWTTLRGRRRAPERDEIDPGALRKILGDSFVITFDERAGHPVRLAGTRLCGLFCRELKGTPFVGLWDEESRPLLRSLVAGVADEAAGVVVGASGLTAGEPPLPIEMVLLPLAHRASLHARLLGVLAPLQTPYWLGIERVTAMSIGTFRNLVPRTAPSLVPALDPERRRARLVVLEGGRSR
ncbi:MAG: PAS domain-containing protein [Rhodoplanes sp.]|uniref:PAS domain-containing protein n=1 Tax=Rhodoplanes sp. TaxID=1968906 RepID=UPI0017D36B42|nr:PAS domain-containing protein [Rhodoplanes sp.]NVO17533.1 PAS domain-containing protein [Rhodoplanes sp.]